MAAAAPASPASATALEQLCATYWYPLYAFIRRQGQPPDAAEDLTQSFFVRFVENDALANVGAEKGRFRTFLLVCLKRFLINEHQREHAAKRGGGSSTVSLDCDDAERRYRLEPAHDLTPEKIFDRLWAATLLERALKVVAQEFVARGRASVFESLKIYLASDASAPPYAQTADALAMSEAAVRVAVHRLRDRYRHAVEEEIRQTLDDESSLDEEIAQLLRALAD